MFMLVSQDELMEVNDCCSYPHSQQVGKPDEPPEQMKWKFIAAPEGSSSRGYNDDVGLVLTLLLLGIAFCFPHETATRRDEQFKRSHHRQGQLDDSTRRTEKAREKKEKHTMRPQGSGANSDDPSGSGIAHALSGLSEELRAKYQDLPDDWHWTILYDFALPAALAFLLGGTGLYILRRLMLLLFPPSPEKLHKDALQNLQKGRERQTESLLRESVRQSKSTYAPAVLSLAALYVYRQSKPEKGLEVLDKASKAMKTVPAEFKAVRQDAIAVMQGHGDMVQGVLAESEFLSALAAVSR
jgi:hypothetical protein